MNSEAQVKENAVEDLMIDKQLDQNTIEYNAINLIPRLYRENKMDTLYAVLNYWVRKCSVSEPSASFIILDEIKNHTFHENISIPKIDSSTVDYYTPYKYYYEDNMLKYLGWYVLGTEIRYNPEAYSPTNFRDYIVRNYAVYYDFLRSLALGLCNRADLSPAESFLVHFYAYPDINRLDLLEDSIYNGAKLQEQYQKRHEKDSYISGIQFSIITGLWVPNGKLTFVGDHPIIGFTLGGRYKTFMCNFNFNYRFVNSARPYYVSNNDTLYKTSNYIGFYAGIDLDLQVLHKNNHEFDLLGGIGLDGFETLFNNNSVNTTFPSANLNFGLGYKILLKYKDNGRVQKYSFLAVQAKYNLVNYCNTGGGTDLSGNAFTISFLYGLYSRRINK